MTEPAPTEPTRSPSSAAPLLAIADLRKEYELHGRALEVLKGVSLTLGQGELLALVGKSGSGKSTLLHIAGTLDSPTSGTVYFEGEDLFAKTESELAKLRNQRIGFVFQSHHLLPEFTAIENVALPLLVGRTPGATLDDRKFGQRLADGMPDWLFARRPVADAIGAALKPLGYSGVRSGTGGFGNLGTLATDATMVEPADPMEAAKRALSDEVRDRAANLLTAVGLGHRLYHRPTELSGGEQQRVAIARALVMRPQLLLADEPTGNLDDATGEEIFRVLLDLNERHGISAVVVTHSERLASRMPRRLRLVDGRLAESPSTIAP